MPLWKWACHNASLHACQHLVRGNFKTQPPMYWRFHPVPNSCHCLKEYKSAGTARVLKSSLSIFFTHAQTFPWTENSRHVSTLPHINMHQCHVYSWIEIKCSTIWSWHRCQHIFLQIGVRVLRHNSIFTGCSR